MSFDRDSHLLLDEAVALLENRYKDLPPHTQQIDLVQLREPLMAAALRLQDSDPYHHPLYIGHMQKPPHPIARLAYSLTLLLNPNNHGYDGGRASSDMEQEAISEIAHMFGWASFQGHLCSGGTLANFEALWIAREQHPDKGIAASCQAHYTHERLSGVLSVPFHAIPTDPAGRMDVNALEQVLQHGDIGTVVVTIGTTATGAVDPLDQILDLQSRYAFRIHVDAAYGGYFTLANNLDAVTRNALNAISQADSIAIDPHKHGLQPYGCGCLLFRDSTVRHHYQHNSPYAYFDTDDPHLGEISLECSRPGASAVALWTTQRLLPLVQDGTFAQNLASGRNAALIFYQALIKDTRFAPLFPPQLDIVVWAMPASSASLSSQRARALHAAARKNDLHMSLVTIPQAMLLTCHPVSIWDQDSIICLRVCLMKPEHHEWITEILARLNSAAASL
ncbi:MAG TPA: pyridoxal-dependent decarboxylase [Thiobacillus sp.]